MCVFRTWMLLDSDVLKFVIFTNSILLWVNFFIDNNGWRIIFSIMMFVLLYIFVSMDFDVFNIYKYIQNTYLQNYYQL